MTMVTPIHLLLFGARKIEYSKGFVLLDNWYVMVINLTRKSNLRRSFQNIAFNFFENNILSSIKFVLKHII